MTTRKPFPRWAVLALSIILPVLLIGSAVVAIRRSGNTGPDAQRQRLLRQFRRAPTPFVSEYLKLVDLSREARDYPTAIAVLKAAAAEQPKNAFIFELLGDVYMEAGNVAGAEPSYRRAIANDPGAVFAYLKLSDLLWNEYPGRASEIEPLVRQGLRAIKSVNLLKRLARYYTDVGRNKEALAAWEKVLKEDSENEGVKEEIRRLGG